MFLAKLNCSSAAILASGRPCLGTAPEVRRTELSVSSFLNGAPAMPPWQNGRGLRQEGCHHFPVDFSLCPYRAAIMKMRILADTLLFHPLMAGCILAGDSIISCPGRALGD